MEFERLYACDEMFFCVLFSVTSKLMQSIYDPRIGIYSLKWNILGIIFLRVVISNTINSFDEYACA